MMPGQVSDFWGFKLLILSAVPVTLPLSYALKPTKNPNNYTVSWLFLIGHIMPIIMNRAYRAW